MKIYVAAVEAQPKAKDRMKLSLPPKLMEKTSLGPSYFALYNSRSKHVFSLYIPVYLPLE